MMNVGTKTSLEIVGEPGKVQKACQKESKNYIKKAPRGKGHTHMLMGC